MAMTQYNGDPEVISKLGTTPQERGLTTEQFKAKFDEGLKAFVTWFNDTHKTDFDAKAETTSLNALQNEVSAHKAEKATDEDVYSHVRKGVRVGDVLYVLKRETAEKANVSVNLGPISPSETRYGNQVFLVVGFLRQGTAILGRGLWTIHRYFGGPSTNGVAIVTPIYEHGISIDISTGEIILSNESGLVRAIEGTLIRIL